MHAVVVHRQPNIDLRWHAVIDRAQELQGLIAEMTPMQLANHLPLATSSAANSMGAMAHIIMTRSLGNAKGEGNNGCVRSSTWILDF
jgi:hypothetical protein